ncbi:MAG TPA: cysteine desulfurase family protein [Spirochaetia bacterium]|nr:cysteine desulfurase family protein [Spirochaetales bacterium]HPD80561.1 cysteine desulfurase family protein [Spirochaetales bacterium]HQK33750.1 cysteine desulfurase family protein [Spirochaetales bacterium]HRS64633.1 cysteine desulfurase family protein [Spirochaetia bacterium]HRV28125.1 cysteine desulfurase family protein [Spirochaetia bacterium]
MKPIYLDWAATAVPDTAVLEQAFTESIQYYANVASRHDAGKQASELYESSRAAIARFIGCKPEELIATSGATEANAIILLSLLQKQKCSGTVLISSIEHDSIFNQARVLEKFGYTVKTIPVNRDGFIEPDTVASLLTDDTVLIAVMAVNNETGAIQPIEAIASIVASHKKPMHVHVDAVQAFGKIPLTIRNIHSMSLSAHKLGGPKGFGLLYLSEKKPIQSLFQGGNQERSIRSGTQNLYGMRGFALAVHNKNPQTAYEHVSAIAARLISGLASIPQVVLIPENRNSNANNFSPYIVACSVPGLTGEVIVRYLSDNGIMISTGSACSSKHTERRVLNAMNIDKKISQGAIRISLGPSTTQEQIDAFITMLDSCIKKYKP